MSQSQHERQRLAHDPHRPRYHFLPPSMWMNDPNGLTQWRGQYHMFYQYNPHSAAWGYMHWGHAVSSDLVHWRDLPIALSAKPGADKRDGCWSGCFVNHDGVPTIVYTGVDKNVQRPFIATGDANDPDLVHWTNYEGNPVIANPPEGYDQHDFRDHSIWREGDTWYQVIGAGIEGVGGAAALYRSTDLYNWEYLHPLSSGELERDGAIWECPDFFALGDKHVLIYSPLPQCYAVYNVGEYRDHKFVAQATYQLDFPAYFYAPQSFTDDQGRRIMFGWIKEGRSVDAQIEAEWSGVMTLPRLMELGPDGLIHFKPAPEVAQLRQNYQNLGAQNISTDQNIVLDQHSNSCEINISFDLGQAQSFGLDILRSDDGQEFTRIAFEPSSQELIIDRRASSQNEHDDRDIRRHRLIADAEDTLNLRIFIDSSVIEIFANETTCATTRAYPSRASSKGIALFSQGGNTQVSTLEIWDIQAIWP